MSSSGREIAWRCGLVAIVYLPLCGLSAPSVHAQSGDNVAVVINENSAASKRIGEYYAAKRRLPPSNVIRIRTSEAETIARAAFDSTIHGPIGSAIAREGVHDRILYVVLTKGIPLRIEGTSGLNGTTASVDSELALLYRRMAGGAVPLRGPVANPYFLGNGNIHEARPFTHREQDIYLVCRLDAFTVEEALALVDRGMTPTTDGRIVLDQRAALRERTGEDWLTEAASRLTMMGHGQRVLLETTPKPARDVPQVLGYYGWGSVDPQNRVRELKMGFVPGSIAATFASSDARTFQEPPKEWIPTGAAGNQSTWYAGAPHSLVGDLIREGATGVAGHVREPYLQSVVRPQILFSAYLAGFNLAEAFYLALPHLSWQGVVIGDPLCTPFPRKAPASTDLAPDLDARTELPGFFSARRLDTLKATIKSQPEALALLIQAETQSARGRPDGARAALTRAVTLDPRLTAAHLQLALLDEQAGRTDAAMSGYRRVLELNPHNVAALNNLAYTLSVVMKQPAEAKSYAERAMAAAPRDPLVMDTLGWIEYLLGNHAAALKLLSAAAIAAPTNAEVRLHTAFAAAAAGAPGAAASELKAALALDRRLEERQDVRELRTRLERALK